MTSCAVLRTELEWVWVRACLADSELLGNLRRYSLDVCGPKVRLLRLVWGVGGIRSRHALSLHP